MKICPQCSRTYADETVFCLSDGTPLVVDLPEEQTVVRHIPAAGRTTQVAPPARKSTFPLIAILAVALLLALGVVAVAAFLVVRQMNAGGNSSGTNTAANRTSNQANNRGTQIYNKADDDALAALEAERERLQREKDKLEKDKKALANEKDQWKKESDDFQHEDYVDPKYENRRSAKVTDPPTNVRETPNGKILCVIPERRTIKVYGAPGFADNNGFWLYTDECGPMGLIHSSQLKF